MFPFGSSEVTLCHNFLQSCIRTYTQSWSDLQSESADCKRAMEEELKRLEGLESLANQIVSECTKVESGVNDFEAKLSDFEENSMSMTPEEAASVSEEIRGQLETLQEGLSQQAPLVEQLKEGNYHSSEEVDKRCAWLLALIYSACIGVWGICVTLAMMIKNKYFCFCLGAYLVYL